MSVLLFPETNNLIIVQPRDNTEALVLFGPVVVESDGGGVSDHGALTGLADDDHPQYALSDGSRGSFATPAQGAKADSAVQDVGAEINAATAATLDDADAVGFFDSVASALRKITWANVKATIKTYTDTLYSALGHGHANTDITGLGGAAVLAVGTTAGTVAAGDDSRMTNDRTASGLRSATTVVSVSAATAPSSGQVLTATSSTAATWQTPSGGAGTDTFCIRSPLQNEPPASAFSTLDTRNSIPCLDFDAAADESAIFSGFAPEAIVLTSGIIARIVHAATSATSGNIRWRVKFERRTTDQDSDSWDTATEATAATNGTSGICTVTEITCTTIDSIVAGDSFRVCVTRVGTDGTNDTMTGDAELFGFELRAA